MIVIAIYALVYFGECLFGKGCPMKEPQRCRIVGDREYVEGNCIPYCPPHPSECR